MNLATPVIDIQRGIGTMCLFTSDILVNVQVENREIGLGWTGLRSRVWTSTSAIGI